MYWLENCLLRSMKSMLLYFYQLTAIEQWNANFYFAAQLISQPNPMNRLDCCTCIYSFISLFFYFLFRWYSLPISVPPPPHRHYQFIAQMKNDWWKTQRYVLLIRNTYIVSRRRKREPCFNLCRFISNAIHQRTKNKTKQMKTIWFFISYDVNIQAISLVRANDKKHPKILSFNLLRPKNECRIPYLK